MNHAHKRGARGGLEWEILRPDTLKLRAEFHSETMPMDKPFNVHRSQFSKTSFVVRKKRAI
jgi:hypothetical protein